MCEAHLHREAESATLPWSWRLDCDLPMMLLNYLLDDREAKSDAFMVDLGCAL